jgi:hypothetical protein
MTMPNTSGEVFAAASSAMVRGVDSASTVHVLLADCLTLMGADSAGVLLRIGDHGVDVLATTSHQAAELEVFQSQSRRGPCIESMESGDGVTVAGTDALVERWPDVGRVMAAAGFHTVHAEPMHWHGQVLGGINLFWRAEKELTQAEHELMGAVADICSLTLMQVPHARDPDVVVDQLRVALEGRVTIERAKGVLAQVEAVDMAAAFDLMVRRSREQDRPLAVVAEDILTHIITRPGT